MPLGAVVTDLLPASFPSPAVESAEQVDIDRQRLIRRLKAARRSGFRESNVVPCTVTPFDVRWAYVDGAQRAYLEHVAARQDWIGIAPLHPPLFTRHLVVSQCGGVAVAGGGAGATLRSERHLMPIYTVHLDGTKSPNLSRDARSFATRTGIAETDLFHHAIAILAAGGPASQRIPLPDNADRLRYSAILGYRVARLFCDDESALEQRLHDAELRELAVPQRSGKEARMLRASALLIAEEERCVVRDYSGEELAALRNHARCSAITLDEALALLGERTCDIHINDKAFFRNVPANVWAYAYDGAAALCGWLRDRRASAIGRALTRDEVTHFSVAARRIASLLLLAPSLQRNAAMIEEARPLRTPGIAAPAPMPLPRAFG